MNLKRINESFKKLYEDSKPFAAIYDGDLKTALMDAMYGLQMKGNNNIKSYEVAFQDVIEKFYPEKSWWDVTDVNIFWSLFEGRNPEATINEIVNSIKVEETLDFDEEDYVGCEKALQEVLDRMNEDTISDGDKADSDLIRGMLQKMKARSNAAFTPEEKAVMNKYGITRDNWNRTLNVDGRPLNRDVDTLSHDSYYRSSSFSNGTPSKINYADRARKLPQRKGTQIFDGPWTADNDDINAHGGGRTRLNGLQDAERYSQEIPMRDKITNMKNALRDRKWAQSKIDNADAERERRMAAAQAAFDKAKRDADRSYEYDTVDSAKSRDRAQAEIDSMLKRKKESLTEGALDENPIIAWLGEHEQAWEDFTTHFVGRDISELSDDEIIGWISEHDQLYADYKNYFKVDESLTEDLTPIIDELKVALDAKGLVLNTAECSLKDAAEYIEVSKEALGEYTVEDWIKDTQENYPETFTESINESADKHFKVTYDSNGVWSAVMVKANSEDEAKEIYMQTKGQKYPKVAGIVPMSEWEVSDYTKRGMSCLN